MLFGTEHLTISLSGFVENFITQLSHPFNAYPFSALLVAINCEEKVGDESREDLNHKAMLLLDIRWYTFRCHFHQAKIFSMSQ